MVLLQEMFVSITTSIHGNDFKYVGLDLFGESAENANEVIPNTKFNNPLKRIYFEYILKTRSILS